MKLFTFLAIALTTSLSAQVGINTSDPEETFDVNGTVQVRDLPLGTNEMYLVVANEKGKLHKISLSGLNAQNSCPTLVDANAYYVRFIAPGYVARPNDPVKINGLNFNSAEAQITQNVYRYSYTNTSGQVLNTSDFTVEFGNLKCNYKQ